MIPQSRQSRQLESWHTLKRAFATILPIKKVAPAASKPFIQARSDPQKLS
jgi:hypothetical protein